MNRMLNKLRLRFAEINKPEKQKAPEIFKHNKKRNTAVFLFCCPQGRASTGTRITGRTP